MEGGGGELKAASTHFRRWVSRNLTGCLFASHLAGGVNRIAVVPWSEPPSAADIDHVFDASAIAKTVPVVLLPLMASEVDLVAFINGLPRSSRRWTLRRRTLKTDPATSGLALGIEWLTPAGQVSEVMGFAPLATMPVTRRAPYIALTSWPGEHGNPWRTPAERRKRVSFVDAAHGLPEIPHDEMYAQTERGVAQLLAESQDRADHYRRVAFVVSRRFEADLRFAS